MKNIKVPLGDETYHRRAQSRVAALGTSVPALVREFLGRYGDTAAEFERLKRQGQESRARVPVGFRAGDRLSRDELHRRRA